MDIGRLVSFARATDAREWRTRPSRARESRHPASFVAAALVALVLSSGPSVARAVEPLGIVNPPAGAGPENELHVARLAFVHGAGTTWGPGRPWWRIDWPEAEEHFGAGVARYTSIDIAADSAHVTLLDDALFDYPWLFAQQVGRWSLTDAEASRLGEYLARGGFLVVDDFHGEGQWRVFADVMARVLPGARITDVPADDPLLNVLYELDRSTQIPGRRHLVGVDADGRARVRMPGGPPRWRAFRDANGRLAVAINFNMDMGDAWEHADDPVYPVPMTSLAYRFGINYLLYAMTH